MGYSRYRSRIRSLIILLRVTNSHRNLVFYGCFYRFICLVAHLSAFTGSLPAFSGSKLRTSGSFCPQYSVLTVSVLCPSFLSHAYILWTLISFVAHQAVTLDSPLALNAVNPRLPHGSPFVSCHEKTS